MAGPASGFLSAQADGRVSERLPELLDAKALRLELGVTRAAAEAIMRHLQVVQIEGLRKVYVRRSDVVAYLDARTSRTRKYHRDAGRASGGFPDKNPPRPSRCRILRSSGNHRRRVNVASSMIITRRTSSGPRYIVRYRLGGRAYPVVHAGSFKTLKEAKARRDFVAGELSAGRNPADALRALAAAPTTILSVNTWADRFVDSRIDLAENTRKMYRSHLRKIGETFGDRSPATITAAEVAEWVAGQAEERKAGTVAQYLDVLKVLLDCIGIEPNPARDPKVKLPKRVTEEANPPADAHFLAIVEALLPRWRLFFITIEQGGLRIGEAAALRWGDVDAAGKRLRLPCSATKTKTARWVQLPQWLMDVIEDTCPLEDRVPERRVFQGLQVSAARQAMTRACRNAKIPHYSPHDLRHRRLSLWHQSGVHSPNAQDTPVRRCRSTSTRTSCRSRTSHPSESCLFSWTTKVRDYERTATRYAMSRSDGCSKKGDPWRDSTSVISRHRMKPEGLTRLRWTSSGWAVRLQLASPSNPDGSGRSASSRSSGPIAARCVTLVSCNPAGCT